MKIVLLAGAAFLAATSAQAVTRTIVQTADLSSSATLEIEDAAAFSDVELAATFDGRTFDPFDAALGTLLDATLAADLAVTLDGTATYFESFDSGTGTVFYDGFIDIRVEASAAPFSPPGGSAGAGFSDVVAEGRRAVPATSVASASAPVSYARTESRVAAYPLDDARMDTGLIFETTVAFIADGFNIAFDGAATVETAYTLTYRYDDGVPAIPLPAGLPLLAGALGGLILLRRRG